MILVMCWIFPTINRLYIFASKKPNFVLSCLHTIFFSLTGFFNSLVYSYYYRKFIPCIKCFFDLKEDSQTENKIKNDNNEKVEIKPSSYSPQIENGYVLNVTEKETGKCHLHERKNTKSPNTICRHLPAVHQRVSRGSPAVHLWLNPGAPLVDPRFTPTSPQAPAGSPATHMRHPFGSLTAHC